MIPTWLHPAFSTAWVLLFIFFPFYYSNSMASVQFCPLILFLVTWAPVEGATFSHKPNSLFCYIWNHSGISKLLAIDLMPLVPDHDFWGVSLTYSLFASNDLNKLSELTEAIKFWERDDSSRLNFSPRKPLAEHQHWQLGTVPFRMVQLVV